jgi:uncharacterized protein (TIGR02646 family)
MKLITKTSPPSELSSWISTQESQADPVNYPVTYDEFGKSGLRPNVRQFLEAEQFGLCGYTCELLLKAAIRPNTESHIEHIKPVNVCKAEAGASYGTVAYDDLNYHNIIAATFIRSSRAEWYGARYKDNTYTPALFVSPLIAVCEQKFRYLVTGDIQPMNSSDADAIETIRQLKLDHPTLVIARRAEISVRLHSPDATSYSVPELQKIIDDMKVVDASGMLPNFSFIIQQIAEDFLKVIQSP